jgi:ribosomal protein S1
MLGAEIDFIVRGIDKESRSVVASRKAAMLRKRQTFYMDTNEQGEPMIYEGRIVQARVIGVAEKVLRVEIFGVECAIFARDLAWTWFGDAREQYSVGDRVLVRVLTIDRADVNRISITADIRSVASATSQENLKKIMPQCRYVGQVTDFRNGVAYIRLNNGVNAIAHTCYDRRMPGKKDDVSFAVTRLDEERGIAVGIITRIIKQNL